MQTWPVFAETVTYSSESLVAYIINLGAQPIKTLKTYQNGSIDLDIHNTVCLYN